jgi:hypothetical protein
MKKKNLSHLATLGLMSGLVSLSIPSEAKEAGEAKAEITQTAAVCSEPSQSKTDQLFGSLNQKSKDIYNSLSCEGKNLAMKLAMASPGAPNMCAGLNSCSGGDHKCAGLGSCEGTGSGYFKDKNKAVEVAQKAMANKRSKMLNK